MHDFLENTPLLFKPELHWKNISLGICILPLSNYFFKVSHRTEQTVNAIYVQSIDITSKLNVHLQLQNQLENFKKPVPL